MAGEGKAKEPLPVVSRVKIGDGLRHSYTSRGVSHPCALTGIGERGTVDIALSARTFLIRKVKKGDGGQSTNSDLEESPPSKWQEASFDAR